MEFSEVIVDFFSLFFCPFVASEQKTSDHTIYSGIRLITNRLGLENLLFIIKNIY